MPFRQYLIDKINEFDLSEKDKSTHISTIKGCNEQDLSRLLYEIELHKVYKEYPVDIDTFIHDPYYLGSIYSESIFPMWENLLKEVYPAPLITKYNEVILSAATRSGKTTSSAISILYEIYKLMCMYEPAKFYMGKGTARLTFALISKDEANVETCLGMDIQKGLLNAPYFIDNITNKLAFSNLCGKGVQVTDNILIIGGSKIGTVVGKDLFAAAIDEFNMPSPTISDGNLVKSRMALYNHIIDRKEATLSKAPPMSGILWLMSSPTEEDDAIGERISSVEKIRIPDVKVLDNIARWDARDEYLSDTFDFYLGSDTKDPQILTQDSDYSIYESEKIIKIPYKQEYFVAFQETPIEAIRDIAGRRTTSDAALFNSVAVFGKVFYKKNNIFTKDLITIDFNNDNKKLNVPDYLYNTDYFKTPNDKNCYRYMHLDIASKKDKFGLASVYSNMVKFTSDDGIQINKRMYFTDFCLGIVASKGCSVDIVKVLEFIYSLKKEGYPLKLVTTDTYQGVIARQIMKTHGVDTEHLSVETSKEPYYNLKNLIITESLVGYENPYLIKELGGLRDFGKKIDKSKGNTDDLSGALAGALYNCMLDKNFKTNEDHINYLIGLNQTEGIINSSNERANLVEIANINDFISSDDLSNLLMGETYNGDFSENIINPFGNMQNNNRMGNGW